MRLLRLAATVFFVAVGLRSPKGKCLMEHVVNHDRPAHTVRHDIGKTATESQHAIEALATAKDVRLAVGDHTEVPLPDSVLHVLVAALKEFAKGKRVSVVAAEAEMTTQQAADLLLVSRPYLIGLLDAGKIPYRKVGTKRRILAADVLAYKAKEYKRRGKLLDELAAESQRLGLY
jgi:excisionase family DNA binding protein